MDPHRFDQLARAFGEGASRRGLLKTLGAGALGALATVVGRGSADAASAHRANGQVCFRHGDCATGACYPRNSRGRRVCGPNLCTEGQVVCQPLDDCHVAGVCDPPSGVCSNPPAADGAACQRFSGACAAGTCALFSTLSCTAGSQCESQCPSSGNQNCFCGTTIEGDPVCYSADHGCASGDYCTSSGDCGAGSACVNLNDGCGGCDAFTGGKGICNARCTS